MHALYIAYDYKILRYDYYLTITPSIKHRTIKNQGYPATTSLSMTPLTRIHNRFDPHQKHYYIPFCPIRFQKSPILIILTVWFLITTTSSKNVCLDHNTIYYSNYNMINNCMDIFMYK